VGRGGRASWIEVSSSKAGRSNKNEKETELVPSSLPLPLAPCPSHVHVRATRTLPLAPTLAPAVFPTPDTALPLLALPSSHPLLYACAYAARANTSAS
jgi:hypothetical protein